MGQPTQVVPILTARLAIRRLDASDADAVFRYRSDPEISRYLNWAPASVEEVRSFIVGQAAVAAGTPGRWTQLGLYDRLSGKLIGDIGLRGSDTDSRQVEIGITLAPEHQGRGLATEAVRAMLEYLLVILKKHRVIASVDPRNTASLALLERVGMRREAHHVESLWFKGAWADDVIFAMLKRELPSRSDREPHRSAG